MEVRIRWGRSRLFFCLLSALGGFGCGQTAATVRKPSPAQPDSTVPAPKPERTDDADGREDRVDPGVPTTDIEPTSSAGNGPATLPKIDDPDEPAPSDPRENLAVCRRIVGRATDFFDETDAYTCRVTRQEKVGQKKLPREVMLMDFLLRPRSVHYRWLDERNLGRECVFVEGRNDGKLVTTGGRSDFLFVGRRISVDPDGFLARAKSRYSIREAGLDNMVAKLRRKLDRQATGDHSQGTIRYHGTAERPEFTVRLYHFSHDIPVGADPAFPKGGTRHWYFDPRTYQLALMRATDPQGGFIEYYLFDRFVANPSLDEASFDPDALWPKKPAPVNAGRSVITDEKTATSQLSAPK